MKIHLLSSAALMAAGTASLCLAAEDEPLIITITGTRTAQPLRETLPSTTVIEREDIERSQAKSVAEVLRGFTGVDVTRQGGQGKLTRFFVRGTEPNHVLVLIDGVRHRSATDGAAAFQHLPASQIERIEFVRGPRSSLYGADAIGGVIQIFTREGGEGFQADASAGYGSYDSREATIGLSGGQGGTRYALSAAHYKTEGFDATTPDSFVAEPDDDGYENHSGRLNLSHTFGNGLELEAHVLRAEGRSEFDGGGSEPSDRTTQQIAGLNAGYEISRHWLTQLRLSESRDEFESKDPFFPSVFDTRRRTVEWQNDVRLPAGQLLTLGVDYYEDNIDSSAAFTTTEAGNLGLYGQYQARYGSHEIVAGLRREEPEIFGGETTGNLAWGYALAPGLRFSASYGTGFAAPTFNDLFFPEDAFFVANPDLEPETSQSIEIGLKGMYPRWGWSLHAFYTEIDDLIVFDPNPPGLNKGTVNNLNEAEITGIEAELNAGLADWRFKLNLSWQNPEDPATGKQLARRAERSLRADIDRWFRMGSVGLSVLARIERSSRTDRFLM